METTEKILACKFLPVALMGLSVLLSSCDHSTGPTFITNDIQPLPALNIPWNKDNSVVCFGTSLTYGFRFYLNWVRLPLTLPSPSKESNPGDTLNEYVKKYIDILSTISFDVDSSYPAYMGMRLRIAVYNEGYVGATITRALSLVQDSVLNKKPALVLLEFGANDFLRGVSADTAEVQMRQLVETILHYGAKVVLISFFNPDMINRVPPDYPLLAKADLARAYFEMLKGVSKRYSIEIVDYPLKGIFGDKRYMSDLIHPNGLGYKKMEENISQALLYTFYQNGMLR